MGVDMISKQMLFDMNHPDYKQGIRAYTTNVFKCSICNIQTNLLFKHPDNDDRLVLACSSRCVKIKVGG